MPRAPRIFVAIASYRDPECPATLRELFAKAARPDRISVGLCWQHLEADDLPRGAPPDHARRVRTEVVHVSESRGACWAKARAHALRDGEEYVLQVDSHMRFHPGWDEQLLATLARCPAPRPLLSTYPAPYEPPERLTCTTPHLAAKQFDDHQILTFVGYNQDLTTPRPGAFVAGGYLFAAAALFDEVPYDPALYFIGEEVSFAARAWTRGWDPFSPDVCLVHHLYERKGMPRHWEDNDDWTARNERSLRRVRALLGTDPCDDPSITAGLDGALGLGAQRSLADYEAYCGVDFRALSITPGAAAGVFGPPPSVEPDAPPSRAMQAG